MHCPGCKALDPNTTNELTTRPASRFICPKGHTFKLETAKDNSSRFLKFMGPPVGTPLRVGDELPIEDGALPG